MSEQKLMRLAALLSGSALMALSAPAMAQDANPTATEEEIVVTGSLLAGNPLNSPNPVLVITEEQLQLAGVTSVSDALEEVPALLASNTLDQSLRDAGVVGRVTLNLRGLGTARTLVLVNGKRHVAGQPGTASVDVSSIPNGLIERVDVLTGGASAVYGSDAVTGVVNFILKDDFEGIQFDQQFGISEQGDAPELYASLLAGKNFAGGKGNVTFNVSVNDRSGIVEGDRDFTANNAVADDYENPDLRFQAGDPIPPGQTAASVLRQTILIGPNTPRFAGTDQSLIDRATRATPRAIRRDPRFSISSTAGIIGIDLNGNGIAERDTQLRSFVDTNNNGVNDCSESTNGRRGFGCWIVDPQTGQLRPFRDGVFAGANNQFGGDGSAQRFSGQSLIPETRNITVGLSGKYEISDALVPYVELKAVQNTAENISVYKTFDDYIQIRADNPFIPQAIRNALNAEIAANPAIANTAQITIMRDNTDVINPNDNNRRRTYRGVAGIRGDLAYNLDYDLSFNYGRTEQRVTIHNRLTDRYFASIDAVRDPATGRIVCRSSLDPTAVPRVSDFPGNPFPGFVTFDPRDGSCRPLNLFGTGAPSAEARAFNSYAETSNAEIEQTVVSGFVRGDSEHFFSLPGGPIAFAFGAEWREETSAFTPDRFRQAGYIFDGSVTRPEGGSYDVSEGFVEVSLPLLADLPLIHQFTVTGAYRSGDYSTIGSAEAWKLDGVWSPVPDLRIRGGVAQTVRAPNITELFAPEQSATFRPNDPCSAENINRGPNPANRLANCRADGIPVGFTDPLTARFVGVTSGNRNLEAETAESRTLGIVAQPRFLPGFTATIDYWQIEIDDAIAAVTAQEIVDACYDAPSLNNGFCALFTRNRNAGSPTFLGFNFLRQSSVNFARFEASGIDFALNYALPLERIGLTNWGDMRFGVSGTWNEENLRFESATRPNASNPELGEMDVPDVQLSTSVSWERGPFTARLSSSFVSEQALRGVEIESVRDFTPALAPEAWSHNASLRYAPTETYSFVFGVDNLTNEEPFITETNRPVSALGRYYFVRFGANF